MRDYLELCKPRIAAMVAVTAAIAFILSGGRDLQRLYWTLLGTLLASSASGSLNQLIERRRDALMRRTRNRPLPAGRLQPWQALAFGIILAFVGISLLLWKVGPLPGFLAAGTIALYVLGYTPLKTLTPHSTWVGAAAGASSPLIGWAAGQGGLPTGAWVLFGIQFLWQIPHFLSLFWIHREDYARAGFKVMPVVDPRGRLTAAQIALHSFTLVPASLMPSFCGMAGTHYGLGALALGSAFLGVGMRASWTLEAIDARRLFLASLAYLPILFGMLLWGASL
ncbi:MAG: protoheme IX farnesyltransferase [Elusimicrobia bacterium]|nr:protoheme IX farnesyltransferase [Elusimicrobiota bacterium]